MMYSQTLSYDSPLYGRRTKQIRLKQIPFKYYKEFINSTDEKFLIEAYSVTGGVPKYIEMFESNDDIYTAIKNSILNSQSYLYEEPEFLLKWSSRGRKLLFNHQNNSLWLRTIKRYIKCVGNKGNKFAEILKGFNWPWYYRKGCSHNGR